ncbi:M20/M25/M40 family metallo-hydrolase [Sphingomonas sp. AOB5]|uniref:M20/M25/M40 family metallo-hydrolase n=1 Tax=Sphingomonas sp. AOB5 TaxID=3034017 RepID=UPI0023F788F4|nr:M20/M25/M40 family metallo-hydrolase [Sphingomonas sp. AOB5]MDF7774965.1 M20/M25/M40 family metallo-hydrolase [Sphingomonas sp. AOB5]
MKHLLLSALAMLIAVPASAQLSKSESRIVATIDAEAERTLGVLEKMTVINSGTLNPAGVRQVHDLLVPEFEALGFTVRWSDMTSTGRSGHLIATHKGNGRGKRMLLIGHLDTVFEPSSPFQSWKREGDRAIGPGVVDDKGGIAVILAALRGMQAAGTLKNADIVVVLTGDEERIGAPVDVARKDLIEAGEWADVALEFESLAREGGTDYGTVARRSSSNWMLTVKGKTGHSSTVFGKELGYGAIYELARILDTWRREVVEPNLTYNVSVVGGGTPASIDAALLTITGSGKTNIVPETAIARGDLRSLTPEQDARARAKMLEIAGQNLPGTSATFVVDAGYPPMAPTEGNRALLARLNGVNKSLGLPEMPEYDPAKRGAADSSFVAALADTIAGMGPWGGNSHAEGEWLDIPSISLQAKRAAILMTRLAAEKR